MQIWLLTLCIGFMLTGCASPSRTFPPLNVEQANTPEWQGRISVQIHGDTPSSMSASFLLRGSAHHGELDLYSPFGTTLGTLQWTSQSAQLSDGSQRQYFNSLPELTEKVTGTALPIDALFDWLNGRDAQTLGWQVDLSTVKQGSITAYRTHPTPNVMLRIKLDQ